MPNLDKTSYGPWALITGASSGIGEQFARLLASQGFNLILCARREAQLQTLSGELQAAHDIETCVLALDLSQQNFLETLLPLTQDKDIGLVISNAGFGLKGEHHQQDPQALSDMLNVNACAPLLLSRALSPQLIKRAASAPTKRGGIIFTGSIEGFMGFPQSAAYSATKSFVHTLGEALWQELKHHKIDVLTLAPGSTDTNALTSQGFDAKEMSGVMTPNEVAKQALAQLGHKRLHIAGKMNAFFIRLMSSLPRSWGLAMAEAGMKAAMKK